MQKDLYKNRALLIRGFVLFFLVVFIIRLFYIQVVDSSYKNLANNNVLKKERLYPARGLVYDRNDELVVYNSPIYDLFITKKYLEVDDTLKLCQLLNITKAEFDKKIENINDNIRAGKQYSYKPALFMKQLSGQEYAAIQEFLYQYKGFTAETKTIRKYTHSCGAHLLGDIGEISQNELDNSSFAYLAGDYVGKSGIEKTYETHLRGQSGVKHNLVDVFNRPQGSYLNGALDTAAQNGKNIKLTVDVKLQQYAEQLLQNKTGSIIAIEPKTGEVLAFASSPAFDPNLLCGRDRGKNFAKLSTNQNKPLFNRTIMAEYPPGSTFKPLTALIALERNAIKSSFGFKCGGTYSIPGYTLRCSHGHPSPKNVMDAIKHSCNPYFWQIFRNTIDQEDYESIASSFQNWTDMAKKFGFGSTMGIDLLGEKTGNIPGKDYYNNRYGEKRWGATTIISLAIGQGEITATPLQLANFYAAIANQGYYIKPHLVKQIGDSIISPSNMLHKTGVNAQYFKPIIQGLLDVVEDGTARRSKMDSILFCGKTGTAQNPHGEDHSIFGGFGPVDNPQIAVSVFVENAGGGSRYAAPMASLVIEKYLTDSIANTRKFLEKSILDAYLIDTLN